MRLSVDEVYRRYADRLFSAAFSVCRNSADAEDAVQDTLIKYCGSKLEFENEPHIRAWLLRVTVNRAKDIASSFWRRNRVSWEEYMEELPFEEPEDGRLFEAVMKLPEKQRVVIHLFYYEDCSVSEIAEILRMRANTVKSHLNRGRKLLKNMLEEEWAND